MSHDIAGIKGKEEFAYAGERPWHGLGTQVPGLMKTLEALRIARMDWDVSKVQASIMDANGIRDIPDCFANVRSDNGAILGTVGKVYAVVNNRDAFSFFDHVLGEGHGQIETAGALGIGEKVFMMARFPEVSEIVKGDMMEQFLLVSTSHDGSSNIEVMTTSVRVVCQNTLTAALKSATNRVKIRHTSNWEGKMYEAEKTIKESRKYWAEMEAACKHLAATSVTRVEVGAFMDAMFPIKETAKTRTTENIREKVWELMETGMGTEIPGVKGTAWGVLNAYTEYLDHHKTVKGVENKDDAGAKETARWERSLFGSSYNDRQKAMDFLLTV